jgi:coatomer protein complex subunit gamma
MVVDAIRALCLKYPQKHRVLINFLSNLLREEGGFEFKKSIVDRCSVYLLYYSVYLVH